MTDRLILLVSWGLLLSFDVFSQLAFKLGSASLGDHNGSAWMVAIFHSPWIVAGILGYAGSFFAWMQILRRCDLSLAFPMTSLGYVGVLIVSRLVLDETVDTMRWLGVGCIMAGFAVMIGDKDPH